MYVLIDPIDAIRSSVQDVVADTTQQGAFTFRVALKDRFNNSMRITDKDNKKMAKISVQYSSYTQPQTMRFLQCSTTVTATGDGDVFVLNCVGAEKERILFYPSINNVPLGGQEKYEARTTLCPGRSSCETQGNYAFLPLSVCLCNASCAKVVKMFGNVRVTFGQVLENLRKVVGNLRKIIKSAVIYMSAH